jgi:hypothetical protein
MRRVAATAKGRTNRLIHSPRMQEGRAPGRSVREAEWRVCLAVAENACLRPSAL